MRRALFCLTLLAGAVACENSNDPLIGFEGTRGLSQAQAAGNWAFTVRPAGPLACASGSLADGQVLTALLDVAADGTVASGTSFWRVGVSGAARALSGRITLSSGAALLFLSASSGSAQQMELQGTVTASGTFAGTLRDPSAGSSVVFSACNYDTTGNKTS